MGCGCRRAVANPRSRPIDLRGRDTVTLEYIGDNQGSRTANTPLGNRYRFDGKNHRMFTVLSDDVFYFTQQVGQFEVK